MLRVRVVDHAQVPKDKLRRAVNAARDLFHAAGVETVWPESEDRGLSPGETEVEINILPAWQENGPASKTALGYSLRPDDKNAAVCAFVYYDRVQQAAQARKAFGDELLATVMVHEICHLLGLDHSAEGIMRANLTRSPIGQGSFTPDQVKRLRTAVIARGKIGA